MNTANASVSRARSKSSHACARSRYPTPLTGYRSTRCRKGRSIFSRRQRRNVDVDDVRAAPRTTCPHAPSRSCSRVKRSERRMSSSSNLSPSPKGRAPCAAPARARGLSRVAVADLDGRPAARLRAPRQRAEDEQQLVRSERLREVVRPPTGVEPRHTSPTRRGRVTSEPASRTSLPASALAGLEARRSRSTDRADNVIRVGPCHPERILASIRDIRGCPSLAPPSCDAARQSFGLTSTMTRASSIVLCPREARLNGASRGEKPKAPLIFVLQLPTADPAAPAQRNDRVCSI